MQTTSQPTLWTRQLRRAAPIAALALLAAAGFSGCATVSIYTPANLGTLSDGPAEQAVVTGRVLSGAQLHRVLPLAQLSDTAYAEVNSEWLHSFYGDFRRELTKQGVANWSATFNCKHFAGYYTELAQSRYFVESLRRKAAAQTLALGSIWYLRRDGGRHAIVVAITERGAIFIEPQTGEEVRLSPFERATISLALL